MPNYIYYYVYAPISGTITALENYCAGGPHHTCYNTSGYVNPRDIAGSGTLQFKASTAVKSIRIDKLTTACCSGYPDPYSTGVRVKMYAALNGQNFVGQVFLGHVANASNVGLINNYQATIGNVPSTCPCGPCPCNNDACFTGPHTHMQKQDDTLSIVNPSLYCLQNNIVAGSTWIYRWKILA